MNPDYQLYTIFMFIFSIGICYSLAHIYSHLYAMPTRKSEIKVSKRRIFAENLKRAREDAGLTQEALSRIAGITSSFLSKIETTQNNVSLDKMIALADAVGKPLSQLLTPPELPKK